MSQIDRIQGLVGNVGIKAPCRGATTGNIVLSGEQTIDGLALVTGDRELVWHQTDATENGIWVVDTGGWNRAQDCDGQYDLVAGSLVYVQPGGAANLDGIYRCTSPDPIVVGDDDINFAYAGGVVGSSTINVVDTKAQLKALPVPTSAVTYLVRGGAALADGGGGTYYWNSADVSADNGGTILQPNAGGIGRWNAL